MTSLTKPMTARQVAESVRAMVRDMGRENYRYETPEYEAMCLYDRDRTGSGQGHRCVVGEWLARNGADLDAIGRWETDRGILEDTSIRSLYHGDTGPNTWANLPELSPDAVEWLARAQRQQDDGYVWGAAVLAPVDDLHY